MKKSIFDPDVMNEIRMRIQHLDQDSKPKWGRLNAAQMTRHLNEAARMAFDEVIVPDQSNFLTRTIVKWMFLANIKPPGREKGNIKTFPQVDIVALGTPVNSLKEEIGEYLLTAQRLCNTSKLSARHPLFGKMSHSDWGYLTYAHADYHLTQFNV